METLAVRVAAIRELRHGLSGTDDTRQVICQRHTRRETELAWEVGGRHRIGARRCALSAGRAQCELPLLVAIVLRAYQSESGFAVADLAIHRPLARLRER